MPATNRASVSPSPVRLVERSAFHGESVGERPDGRDLFTTLMKAARLWWRSKPAAELAAIIGCDVRSAERYLAGDRTAGAEAVLKMIGSDVGVRVILVAVARMPAKRQLAFWTEIEKSARRARLLSELDELDKVT